MLGVVCLRVKRTGRELYESLSSAAGLKHVGNCYVPETNHVSRVQCSSCLYLQFVLHVMLFYMLNSLYFTLELPKYVCSALLLGYCLSNFEMVPVAPFISGTIFISTFHMRCDSVVRSLRV